MSRLWLLAGAAATAAPSATGSTSIEELAENLNSSASSEEKTNFLIEYLLSQRSVILDFAKTLILAFIIYLIGKKLVRLCLKLTNKWMVKREVEVSVRNFVMSLANAVYHLILIFIVAWILGVGATIVALVGSAGLAIGLALQGSLSNLAGGVLILALKPFKVGEYISVAGVEGTVKTIDIFYTHLSTTDNKTIVIPNGTITNSTITNTTQVSKRMLVLDFMVDYETDVVKLKELLLERMRDYEKLCQQEPMEVVISKLSPLKVQMQMKAWVKTEDYWEVRYALLEELKDVLEKEENRRD
jgi:small conductance mechanosensitive channel